MKMNILDKQSKIRVMFVQFYNSFWMFKKIIEDSKKIRLQKKFTGKYYKAKKNGIIY